MQPEKHRKNPPAVVDFLLRIKHPKKVEKIEGGTKATHSTSSIRIELAWKDGAYVADADIAGVPLKVIAIPVVDLPGSYTSALYPDKQQWQLDHLLKGVVRFESPPPVSIRPFKCQLFVIPGRE